MTAADRITRREPTEPGRKHQDEGGPTDPNVDRPIKKNPLKERLEKIDKDAAKKYRQRSGQ